MDTSEFTADELERLNEISTLVGDADAQEIANASTYAQSEEFKDLKAGVTDENGVFDASALSSIDPADAKQLVLADLQAQLPRPNKMPASARR